MQLSSDLKTPIDLRPVPHLYTVLASCFVIEFPLIFWMVAAALGMAVSIKLLTIAPVAALVMFFYVKSMTVRLGDVGVFKGLPGLGTLIPYERVGTVRRQVLKQWGTPTALVVSERASGKRIVIRVKSFDMVETSRILAELARRAPQAQIDDRIHS